MSWAPKTARVIFTFDCNRRCVGCCNESMSLMSEARVICSTNDLVGYDEVVITGGEPLLYPDALIDFIQNVRSANPKAKIYLYTATMPPHKPFFIPLLMSLLNGIQYTIHAEAIQTDITISITSKPTPSFIHPPGPSGYT